ncbi:protein prenyltransferase alpha subunit repeat-containing protein 1-like [Liolophura sinensis]|uniref:protein prenyltransferase alpha subunit repeat-containing protein 1-like n=1 Tax=Liolophura sinensis TaxID=3198878 RepID=UPI003159446D
MATDDRGARILSDLNAAFKKDPSIDEYDVIPILEPRHNKSPLVLVDHKLGLELWSVKILYEYSYSCLLSRRRTLNFKKQLGIEELSSLSRAVILVNPECATVWNIRKELVQSGDLSIEEDLKLAGLVLTKHPKSPETYSHRKWLLNRLQKESNPIIALEPDRHTNGAIQNGDVSMDSINIIVGSHSVNHGSHNVNHSNHLILDTAADWEEILSEELCVCEAAASRYPSNYNAWSHRIWVVQKFYKRGIQVLLREMSSTMPWVSSHVSDHSGFHYRQFLLSQLCVEKARVQTELTVCVRDLVTEEMKFVTDLITFYPGHEALWYHRKFVFFTLHKYNDNRPRSLCKTAACANGLTENGCHEKRDDSSGCSLKKTRLENDAHMLCVKEVDSVCQTEMLSSDSEQCRHAQRYVNWIKKVYL